jgi:DNA-binding beta-propeller fold protein YncE
MSFARSLFAALALLCTLSATAQNRWPNWESPHVHPLELTPDGRTLLAVNTADQRLEVFAVATDGALAHRASVPVGVEPVSVRARGNGEAWVVNHLSDNISVVDLDAARVRRTIDTGDEPADVVFAGEPQRAFVSVSQRNQVRVFDPADPAAAAQVIALQGEEPRALVASPDGSRVWVGFFESGNASTMVDIPSVSNAAGPYAGRNPPPNSGDAFDPPQAGGNGPPPRVAHIVRRAADGSWRDGNGRDWSGFVTWNLHDHDLAAIDAASLAVSYRSGLMTTVMALAAAPDGSIAAVGTEALNTLRFEPKVRSIFIRTRIATFDPAAPAEPIAADLNPHLDYVARTIAPAQRVQSIGDPRAVLWDPVGGRWMVAGMGSANVVMAGSDGTRVGRIAVGDGPTGLALAATARRLYVLNRFDASISLVDLASASEVARTPFFDPTTAEVRDGRPMLYDTHAGSGLGQAACASCHVDARADGLAWDLGDPSGAPKTVNVPCLPNQTCTTWHPMKGPMVTQSLQGIVPAGAMHWRGDREDVAAFAPAFVGLQGLDVEPSASDMQRLEALLERIAYPPNPNLPLDGSLPTALAVTNGTGNAATGRNVFTSQPTLGGGPCTVCHALPLGTSNVIDNPNLPLAPQPVKAVQLRGMHEKVGWSRASAGNSRGFGFNSDSQHDTLADLLLPGFNFGPPNVAPQRRNDVEAFLLAFPTETHAAVGAQAAFDGSNGADAALLARLATLTTLADAGTVGLVAKATLAGVSRGYVYAPPGVLLSDREHETTTIAALRAQASATGEVVFTAVPPFTQYRAGVDRDADGWFDVDERDAGSDPADAASLPTGLCRPDFDGDGTLEASDATAFAAAFAAGDPRANFDRSLGANGLPSLDAADQSAYQAAYAAGCDAAGLSLFGDGFET